MKPYFRTRKSRIIASVIAGAVMFTFGISTIVLLFTGSWEVFWETAVLILSVIVLLVVIFAVLNPLLGWIEKGKR